MDPILRTFIAALALKYGIPAGEAAIECIRACAGAPSLEGCLPPGTPAPATRLADVTQYFAQVAAGNDPAEMEAINAEMEALRTEVKVLRAEMAGKDNLIDAVRDDLQVAVAAETTLVGTIVALREKIAALESNMTPEARDAANADQMLAEKSAQVTTLEAEVANLTNTNRDLAEANVGLTAKIAALEAEVANLKAVPATPAKPPRVVAAPVASAASAASGAGAPSITDQGKLKALILDGVETPIHSWRAGAVHLMRLVHNTCKESVPTNWWRLAAGKDSVAMEGISGVWANDPGTLALAERRIRKAKEVLGISVVCRVQPPGAATLIDIAI